MINATLVTIHGFWSSPATWSRLNAVWEADEQLHGLRLYPFSYSSPKTYPLPFSTTRIPDYDDIAQTLATEYTVALGDADNVVIVTHSQGGLIAQRFLAWMLGEGRGRELARIRSIVMLACPNGGSEYLRSIRQVLGYGRHAQARQLKVLDRQVADIQRVALKNVVNATGVDDHQCRIPLHVYAGNSDKVVTAASAQGGFPGASTLAGNHFSILDPKSPGNRTAQTVKYHLTTDLSARSPQLIQQDSPAHDTAANHRTSQVGIRLMRDLDAATGRFRLGALNRGDFGRFRVEVVDARNQDGDWVGPRTWPVPWLEDGSVESREISTFSRPLLDFAHFECPALQEDLESTKWVRGGHWVFPTFPQPVRFRYSAVHKWSDLSRQYLVITVRVIRDEPPAHTEQHFEIGTNGTEPYLVELSGNPPISPEAGKYEVDSRDSQGVQVGDNNVQHNVFISPAPQSQPTPQGSINVAGDNKGNIVIGDNNHIESRDRRAI